MEDESKSMKIKMENNKAYIYLNISNISNLRVVSMSPSDLKGLLDESFSINKFQNNNFNNNKAYISLNISNISSLRTVTIFPGDRKVAGCFYLFSKRFGGMF